MKRKISIASVLACALAAQAATVSSAGDGKLTFTEDTSSGDRIQIDFAKCMANSLFTFSDVRLNGSLLNHTDSDNIGPFLITGHGWAGGNHLESNNKTAHTDKITVTLDGEPFDINRNNRRDGSLLTVEVVNTILLPPSTTAKFATETVTYNVSGNSIEVCCSHEYHVSSPVTVDRYYGMQSMFINETEMLTPGGCYKMWTPISSVSEFTKASAPDFCLFVEHSSTGYQAAWMDPEEGLGDRSMVNESDVVFIGNSWSKSYHKIIGSKSVKSGDKTSWRGVYTWFSSPVTDNARTGDGSFSYLGSLQGENILFSADASGKVTVGDSTSGPVSNGFGRDTEVCDVALIYTGGQGRPAWNADYLRPYVTHRYADGHRDWFYDCFLFFEDNWKGVALGNDNDSLKPAVKADWLEYLEHLFAKSENLHALDALIESYKSELGAPRMPHKVIIGIPAPVKDNSDGTPTWSDINWGSIGSTAMNFARKNHREKATKWFIDQILSRFYDEDFKNIDIAGFYWIEESLYSNSDIIPVINRYINDCSYRAYWIPSRTDDDRYAKAWRSAYKFDMAWLQSDYFFHDGDALPPYSALEETIEKCRDYGMGIELEFETSDKDNGLHEVSADMHQRLVDYIDEFERLGVWENACVAHYSGAQGFYDMDSSSDAVNHATTDRIAALVAKRQQLYSGVCDIPSAELPQFAFPGKGEIYITADEAVVYNAAGMRVHSGSGRFSCPAGLYIATDGAGRSQKIMVK